MSRILTKEELGSLPDTAASVIALAISHEALRERLEAAEKVCEAAAKFEGWDAMLDAINAWEEAKK